MVSTPALIPAFCRIVASFFSARRFTDSGHSARRISFAADAAKL
jgi:hypothetical protein